MVFALGMIVVSVRHQRTPSQMVGNQRGVQGGQFKMMGRYLDPQDALRCRLAARGFASVTAKQLPSSCIRVVANSFQLQLQHESSTSSTSSTRSVPTAAVTATDAVIATQDIGRLVIAAGDHQHQSAPAGEPAAAAATPVAAEFGDDLTCSPALRSRTAASLARAAAAADHGQAFVYVDVQQEYRDQTWQELFGALLSSNSSISALTVVEYCSTGRYLEDVAQRRTHADMAREQTQPGAAGAAVETAGSSNWLPALVSAYTSVSPDLSPSLEYLELQLPAPLPTHLQPLLLQLTGLKTLALYPTKFWSIIDDDPVEPELVPHVVQGLTQLSRLESLTCRVEASTNSLKRSLLNLTLQQAFSTLGRHMTHLSLGTSHSETYYYSEPNPRVQLSAPLVSMINLRSLICKQKFLLDTDDALKSLSRQMSNTLATTGSSSSSGPELQIAPALTKLVLNNKLDHRSVLQLLVGKGINTAAAAAARARSQLVHLELDSKYAISLPTEELSQLAGLRYLKAEVQDSPDITSLCECPLTSQLQGLTLTCTSAKEWDEPVVRYRPLQLATSFTALRSLAIYAGEEVILHPVQDLELLCDLAHLSHLTIQKRYGGRECFELKFGTFRNLPRALRSLVFRLYPDGYSWKEKPHLKFASGAFLSGLTVLEFKGFFVELADEIVAGVAASTGLIASGSEGYLRDAALVASTREPAKEAAPVKAIHDSISGDTGNSAVESPFPSLLQLSADFSTTCRAKKFLRCCRNLQTLDIKIPVPPDVKVDDHSSEGSTVSLQLSQWCPRLSKLRLTLTGHSETILRTVQAADGLFAMIWPGVPGLTELQELTIAAVGTLSYNTIIPCLAALSCLPRLWDLTLQFKPEIGCLRAQYVDKHQHQHEHAGPSASASKSEGDKHPKTGSLINRAYGGEANAERGQPTRTRSSPAELGAYDLLFDALHGCTGLRRLALDGTIVTVDDDELGLGKSMTVDFMFRERSRLMQLEHGLRNCLVVGCDPLVDRY